MQPHHKHRNEISRDQARSLRRRAPIPERLLWSLLRDRQISGLKFRRQYPVRGSIADFCCVESHLVVELDGMSHVGAGQQDDTRTHTIEQAGFRVIRVTNDDVIQHPEAVVEMIEREASRQMGSQTNLVGGSKDRRLTADGITRPDRPMDPSPLPSPRGRGGAR